MDIGTLYVRCQTRDYILDIVAARARMRVNKVNSEFFCVCNFFFFSPVCLSLSLPPLSLYLSLTLPLLSLFLSFSLPSLSSPYPTPTHVSLFIFLSPLSLLLLFCGCLSLPPRVSLINFLSSEVLSLSLSCSCLSFSLTLLSLFSSFSLSPIPVSLFLPSLSFYLSRAPVSLPISISLSFSLSLLSLFSSVSLFYIFYYILMIIYILYYLVFKLVSSFERDSS